jgi:FAD dependent oxidoreductase TIGR03364
MYSSQDSITHHADVIVIGAGVLGTFHAYFAAQMGLKSILIERNSFPSGASTRNFGMVVQTIVETEGEWPTFVRASREIYQSIQEEHDIGVQSNGSLYIASTEIERAVLEEFTQMHSQAYNCSYFNANEALSRYPFIKAPYCHGALHFPDDLTLDPRRMLRQFIPFIVQKKLIEYIPQTTIVSVESSDQHCVVKDAAGNVYTADQIFVCSGADYRTLFPEYFRKSGLRICKLQMMQTESQPQYTLPHAILSGLSIRRYPAFKSTPSYTSLAEKPIDASIQSYGIHLLFKQTSDGSVIIGDSHEYSAFQDANVAEEFTNCHINEAILQYGQQMISMPSWRIQTMWNGYYLIHPEREVYTETINDKIHIVTGIAGKGMSTGPGFARKHVSLKLR